MSMQADQIRADIEQTRHEVSRDVDALADKVTPSKIVERKTRKLRSTLSTVKENVMGAASTAKDGVTDGAETVGDGVHRAASAAKGNPLVAGLVIFGIGWLASSFIPASSVERRAAERVKDAAEPIVRDAGDALAETADHLREPAREAADSVASAATSAATTVRDGVRDAVQDGAPASGSGQHAAGTSVSGTDQAPNFDDYATAAPVVVPNDRPGV